MSSALSAVALQELMAGEGLHAVIDVRPTETFRAGQILGSTSVPSDELSERLGKLIPVASVLTVALGNDERSSAFAAEQFESLGLTNVRCLAGGYDGWLKASLPTTTGWSVPGKDFGERLLIEEGVPEIEADELAQRLGRGDRLIVLDSRTPAEFANSCIPGGRSVPGGELPLAITDILDQEDVDDLTVVVNCAGRTRSILGTFQLMRLGVPNVLALRNGTMGFMLAGHRLETGADAGTTPEYSAHAVETAERAADEIAIRDGVGMISPDELSKLQASAGVDPLYIVDVRMPADYIAGHIPGSITVPGGQIPFSDDQIAIRGATIVAVCDGRARAIFGASLLKLMGSPRVAALDGGVRAWTAAGFALERGGKERPFLGGGVRTREQMVEYLRWEEELGDKYQPSS